MAAKRGVLDTPGEAFADLLARLQRGRQLPDKVADVCHHLRKLGNTATHEDRGTTAQALTCLKLARELGVWFHRTFTPAPGFMPPPFAPPEMPRDIGVELTHQVEALRVELALSETARASAAREAEDARRAAETADERASREHDERMLWEQLAGEEEAARVRAETELRDIQAAAAQMPQSKQAEITATAAAAAEQIVVDEADTRVLIDAQLVSAGWEADSQRLRHAAGTRLERKRAVAIAEWPTATGPADYALFIDGRCFAVSRPRRPLSRSLQH